MRSRPRIGPAGNDEPITANMPVGPLPDPLSVTELPPPVRWAIAPNGTGAWIVTDYRIARQVLSDPRFLRNATVEEGGPTLSPSAPAAEALITMDGRAHSRLRGFVARSFTERRVAELEPFVTQYVGELLDDLMRQERPAEFISTVATPLPFGVLCHVLGVPAEDRQVFGSWVNVLFRLDGDSADTRKDGIGLALYMTRLVKRKRANPGSDLISELAASAMDDDGPTDRELVTLCLSLLMAGYESTIDQIGLLVLALALNDDISQLFRDDVEMVPRLTEELIRLSPSPYISFPRVAAERVTFGAVTIEAGEPVVIFLMGANRDESVFTSPGQPALSVQPPHLTFGHGVHRCLGASLARLQLTILLHALATRMPHLRVTDDLAALEWKTGMATRGLARLHVSWLRPHPRGRRVPRRADDEYARS